MKHRSLSLTVVGSLGIVLGLVLLSYWRSAMVPEGPIAPAGAGVRRGAQNHAETELQDPNRARVEEVNLDRSETAPETNAHQGSIQLTALVLDARSHDGVAAMVSWGMLKALTANNGFIRMAAKNVDLRQPVVIEADGYESQTIAPPPARVAEWNAGQILLIPRMVVEVRVRDGNGRGVADVPVSIASNEGNGPQFRGFGAGATDSNGSLKLRVKGGEFVFAGHPAKGTSASAIVGCEDDVIDLILESPEQAPQWVGLQDSESGQPVPHLPLELVSTKSLPPIHWVGESGKDGVIPFPLPPVEVEIRAIPPQQVQSQAGRFGTVALIDLGEAEPASGIRWLKVTSSEGTWLRFVSASSGETLKSGTAQTFRSVMMPDGQSQEFRLRSIVLANGLIDIGPYIENQAEPMYAIVSAPGYESFDSRTARVQVTKGAVVDVPLLPARLASIQLIQEADGSAGTGGVNCSVWLIEKNGDGQGIQLYPDSAGLVSAIPNVSQPALICMSNNPDSVIAEIQPDELYRVPPVVVHVPRTAQIVVVFDADTTPSRHLRALGENGALHSPIFLGREAVFGCLASGRYVVGTARQLAASRWRRERDSDFEYLLLAAGEVLRVEADKTWIQLPANSAPIQGRVELVGPSSAYVVTLYDRADAEHYAADPQVWSSVDDDGGYSIPPSADILSLAVGTVDALQGVFVPLQVFEVGESNVVARGAHLLVDAGEEATALSVLECRIDAQAFSWRLQLGRGLLPGGAPADFGWVPLGTHLVGNVGTSLSPIIVSSPGLLELVLQGDGSVIVKP